MKHKKTVIIIILMITTIAVLGSLYAIGNYTSQLSNIVDGVNYGRDSTDPEVRLMYATIDGMTTKYYSQDPVVTCEEYITCTSQSQYDYIMNGKISLLNEYGARVTYSYSAYIINQAGQYIVVDSILV